MKKALTAVLLSFAVWAAASHVAPTPTARSAPRYFGEEFAAAQQELKSKPVEEQPQAF